MGDTTARPSHVLEAIDAVQEIGLPVKINAVIKKGVNEREISSMVKRLVHETFLFDLLSIWMLDQRTIGIWTML